jgi:hypothetical protein
MTRKEFEKQRIAIQSEIFKEDCSDPFTYGIRRAEFEQNKFRRLIATARRTNVQTARAKLAQWKRQLERAMRRQAHLEKIRDEIRALPGRKLVVRQEENRCGARP